MKPQMETRPQTAAPAETREGQYEPDRATQLEDRLGQHAAPGLPGEGVYDGETKGHR